MSTPKISRTMILEAKVDRLARQVQVLAENGFKMAQVINRQDITIRELTTVVIGNLPDAKSSSPSDNVGTSTDRSNDSGGTSKTGKPKRPSKGRADN